MKPRFIPETTITVEPNDFVPVFVGDATLGPADDTIWIKVTSLPSGGCPWPWSYGLLTWVTENGRELGTVKINGVCEGEVFKLGVGLSPLFRTGRLEFTPRSYNLKWIELGNPWSLKFSYATGQENPPAQGSVVANAIESFDPDNGNTGLDFTLLDGLAVLIQQFLLR